jgi:hypothetical protein
LQLEKNQEGKFNKNLKKKKIKIKKKDSWSKRNVFVNAKNKTIILNENTFKNKFNITKLGSFHEIFEKNPNQLLESKLLELTKNFEKDLNFFFKLDPYEKTIILNFENFVDAYPNFDLKTSKLGCKRDLSIFFQKTEEIQKIKINELKTKEEIFSFFLNLYNLLKIQICFYIHNHLSNASIKNQLILNR